MTRLFTKRQTAALVFTAGIVCPALLSAQIASAPLSTPRISQFVSVAQMELRGTVLDERGQPVANAVISALGSTSAFAVSDRNGRFTLRDLPLGPYLVQAHLQGYVPARARIIQVTTSMRDISIGMTRAQPEGGPPQVLQAGLGAGDPVDPAATTDTEDHSELAWRLRHAKRSVLKDVDDGVIPAEDDGSFVEGSLAALGRAVGSPARLASVLADLPLNGQINLLTTTSFDRPQDLFSTQRGLPMSVAFVSLSAPTSTGN